jgi:hypothetical protein
MKAKITLSLALLMIAAAAVAADPVPVSFEFGYRFVNQDGNAAMYRTQINERSGFIIRAFAYNAPDLRITGSDIGAGPASVLRLQSGREGAYKLDFSYVSHDSYSALPAFSNPLLSQGIVLSQHTYDRRRQMIDADLTFVPDRAFAPFIGFAADRNSGPSRTTYTIGQDDFVLGQDLAENNREFRAGASFHFLNVVGQVTQGWRSFHSNESFSLPGASSGNNPGPILGQPVSADSIVRSTSTKVSTPFTNAYATAQLGDRLTFTGNYVRFAADSNGSSTETAAGSFTSFAINRFFSGLNEVTSSSARNTSWRGAARAEFNLSPNVDFLGLFQKEHRNLTGSALLDTVFLQTVTFDRNDLKDIRQTIESANSMKREEVVSSAGISARPMGAVSFRAEVRDTQQKIDASPDLAEIVIPGSQSGEFTRKIKTLDSTLAYGAKGWLLSAKWQRDDANRPILRTDYVDRTKLRGRAMWRAPKYFSAGVTAEWSKQTNDQSDVGLNASVRQYLGDVELTPISWLALRGSFTKFESNSDVIYRVPQNFTVADSRRFEDGRSNEASAVMTFAKWSLDAGLGRFKNEGTSPFTLDHYRARFSYDLTARTGFAAEWNRDQYEDSLAISDFRADRVGIYFRWLP